MSSLNELIINELQRTEVKDLSRLINYMKGERGFFWVRSGEHDHWTNGTAQHSWRVYQYMRYMWENPCEIPCNRKALNVPSYKADPALAPDKVKTLTENEIILTGLLHDVGKMWGCNHHASNSRKIIDSYLGEGFSEVYPKIVASIYFHHHKEKDGGFLNAYRNTTLRILLNKADSMASGTTWHSIRFIENRSQRYGRLTSDIKHLRRGAMDRTRQVLDYRMYLDYTYKLQTITGFASKNIVWNTHGDWVKGMKKGTLTGIPLQHKEDFISHAHRITKDNKNICLIIGIDLSINSQNTRDLRQDNQGEEEFLICSNTLMAFYKPKENVNFRYSYTMRGEIKQRYQNQSIDEGIFLPQVTFFRDGVSEGFRLVAPWTCDVLLVPGWKGGAIIFQQ